MRIVELHQQQNELSNSEVILFSVWIISVTFADEVTGLIISMRFVDEDKPRSDRRYNMLQALAEFDGGQGIDILNNEG